MSCKEQEVKAVFTQNNCDACHGEGNELGIVNLQTGNVGARIIGIPTTTELSACKGDLLIDHNSPEDSLILSLIDKGRHEALKNNGCDRPSMPQNKYLTDQEVLCVQSWVEHVAKTELPPEKPQQVAFEFASPHMALSKAKYILHGGTPTEEEFSAVAEGSNQLDPQTLRNQIIEWEKTPQYEKKIRNFLDLALQQKEVGNANYAEQFNNIRNGTNRAENYDAGKFEENLNTMFSRTAWRIFSQNNDFRNVLSTRTWEVTTAGLAALAWLDKPNQPGTKDYRLIPRLDMRISTNTHLIPSDFEDWRTVTFEPSGNPANYQAKADFMQSLRDIPDGGTLKLRYPRLGFFSSPVFLNYWETNDDNMFRVTIQQTLIVALNKRFDASDNTVTASFDGIDEDHAGTKAEGKVCYQCHRMMDPMKLVFENYLVSRYRSKPTDTSRQPGFAFVGVSETFNNPGQFAKILRNHPEFAKGWVQKLCLWGNSMPCDESDPEYQRLVNFFKSNKFNLRLLLRQFFSSPIFTANEKVLTHENNGYLASLSRSNHICHALETRLESVKSELGTSGESTVCRDNAMGVIPEDGYARGAVDLVQATHLSLFDAKSIDRQCSVVANRLMAAGNPFDRQALNNEQIFAAMVRKVWGYPNNHPQYQERLDALKRIYAIATHKTACEQSPFNQGDEISCGMGLDRLAGLRTAWFTTCSSPEVISVGF